MDVPWYSRPVTVAGTELPAGSTVFVAYGSANRDEHSHDRPDVFDITRPLSRRHVAFGHGAHGCPGSQLAREQLALTLELLTRRLPGLRLDEERTPVVMRPTLIHRSPEALHRSGAGGHAARRRRTGARHDAGRRCRGTPSLRGQSHADGPCH